MYGTDTDEYRPYLAYHPDGLVDIFAGLGLLFFGIAIFLDVAWLGVLYPAIFIPAWQLSKRSITRPRVAMGEAASAQFVRPRYTLALMGAIIAVIFGLGLTLYLAVTGSLVISAGEWLRTYVVLYIGALSAGFLAVIAFVNEVKRFYGYAALTLALFVVGNPLDVPVAVIVSLLGLMMIAGGLSLLTIFMQSHPQPAAPR